MGVLSYVKTLWQDRAVATPNTYTKSGETGTEVTLVPKTGTVTQAGTPINAARLNNMETGIAGALQAGALNSDISILKAVLVDADTRGVYLFRNADLTVNYVEERDGATVIRKTTLVRVNTVVNSVVQVSGGITVTYTLNRNATTQKIESITKTVA